MEYLHRTSFGIGVLGVLVIVLGVTCGLLRFVRSEFLFAWGKTSKMNEGACGMFSAITFCSVWSF